MIKKTLKGMGCPNPLYHCGILNFNYDTNEYHCDKCQEIYSEKRVIQQDIINELNDDNISSDEEYKQFELKVIENIKNGNLLATSEIVKACKERLAVYHNCLTNNNELSPYYFNKKTYKYCMKCKTKATAFCQFH